MKNLKRILSLALASTMLVGMLVVGANAATFSDSDKITHADAVETLSALGILNGMGDGTFAPQGTLTRAQMAKILATVFNNGDDDLSFAVNEAKPTFTDVKPTAWYAGAVEYAANFKIVNGMGDGTFAPESKLTVAQAARMTLNAMGYNQGEGDWKLNTIIQAREVKIFEGLTADEQSPNKEMTRDAAAQMLYNAINAPMANAQVTQTTVYALSTDGTEDNIVTSYGYFDSVTDADTFAKANSDDGNNPYKIVRTSLTKSENLGEKYLGLKTLPITVNTVKYDSKNEVYKVNNTYTVAEDVSNLLGHTVTVLYKGSGASMKTYGFVDGSVVLGEGNVGDLGTVAADAKKIKLNGEELDLAGNANTIDVCDLNTATSEKLNAFTATGKEYNKIVAISDNGKTVSRLVTTPVKFGTVGYVGNTQFTVTGVDTYETAKVSVYEGIAKNDLVLVTPADNTVDGKAKIEKAPVTEGATANAVRGTKEVRVDGEWYTSNNSTVHTTLSALGKFDVVILNGYIVSAVAVSTGSSAAAGVADVFMVTAVGDFSAASTFKGTPALVPVRIITATGEVTEINVAKIYDEEEESNFKAVSAKSDVSENTLYTADKDKNGNYNLTPVEAGDDGKWSKLTVVDQGTNAIEKGETTISSTKYRFSDDAVVFVYSSGKFGAAVLKGSDVKIWASTTPTTGGAIYTETKNGFPYVSMALVNLGSDDTLPGEAAVEGLGWITTAAVYTKNGDTAALELEIFDGETTRTVYATGLTAGDTTPTAGDAATYAKGTFVTFEESADNTVAKLTVASGVVADTIVAWDGDEIFKLGSSDTTERKLETDKWTVMYLDTKAGKGAEGGEIQMANKSDLGDYVENVYADATNKILVVDVNNLLAELKTEVTFEEGAVITAVNDGKTEVTVAENTDGDSLKGAAEALTGAKSAKVLDANGDAVTSANVADGYILQITTESGRLYNLTIKIATDD